MIKIKIIFAGPCNPDKAFRKLDDLLSYQDLGVELYLGHNAIGPIHCQNDIEQAFASAGMAQAAILAEQEGMDAIVIESMGDTGLIQCREAVKIPVVGMSDSSLRVAQMLGRKFGVITAGSWHGYALERLMRTYNLTSQYVGFQSLDFQPFFIDASSENQIEEKIISAITKLIEIDADTIILGGSYFLGKNKKLSDILNNKGYRNILIIDPLPMAIRFARMLVDSDLSHSKLIYANPKHATQVIGYPTIPNIPGVNEAH